MGSRVLVTGVTGFVGRELCAQLVASGIQVVGVGRSQQFGNQSGVAYHCVDLSSGGVNGAVLEGVDCVVHLAGQAHGKGGSESQELESFRRNNVDASTSLAKHVIEAGVPRFVFVSSIGVHGTVTDGAAVSEHTPFSPASPYSVSKMEAELELTKLFGKADLTELTIVRPPLVYGHDAPGNFKSLLGLVNTPFPLPFGMCSNHRSLISLTSLVDFLIACTHQPEAGNESFVVADTSVVSTRDIVSSLRRGMGRAARLVPVPPVVMSAALDILGKRDMYSQLFCDMEIDNRKAKTLVEWLPCESTTEELEVVGKRYADSCV